jgi:hypothetical protein
MDESVFLRLEFFGLVASSIAAPSAIFGVMLWKRAMSRVTVFLLGLLLIVLTFIDVILLVVLEGEAKLTASLADDQIFASEVTIALYVLPAVLAGIGTNIVADLLTHHLEQVEKRFDAEHSDAANTHQEPKH